MWETLLLPFAHSVTDEVTNHLHIHVSFFFLGGGGVFLKNFGGNGDWTSLLRFKTPAHSKLTSADLQTSGASLGVQRAPRSPAASCDCCQLPINTYGMLIRPQRSATPPDFSDPLTTSAFISTKAHGRSAYASCMCEHKEPRWCFRSWTEFCGMWIQVFRGHVLNWFSPFRLVCVTESFKEE